MYSETFQNVNKNILKVSKKLTDSCAQKPFCSTVFETSLSFLSLDLDWSITSRIHIFFIRLFPGFWSWKTPIRTFYFKLLDYCFSSKTSKTYLLLKQKSRDLLSKFFFFSLHCLEHYLPTHVYLARTLCYHPFDYTYFSLFMPSSVSFVLAKTLKMNESLYQFWKYSTYLIGSY